MEAQIGRETTAKDILFDFMTAFEKRLVEVGAYSAYLEIILSEIQKGEVLFAHRDSKSAEFIESYIPNSPYLSAAKEGGNFIYPVFTSLSGNKSDRYMNRVFTFESRPSSASG